MNLDGNALEPRAPPPDLLALPGATGETQLDEAFFPILWLDGYRTPWLSEYAAAGALA